MSGHANYAAQCRGRVITLQRKKKIPDLKLQAICGTNAHLLIQINREHQYEKMNYRMNKVQILLSCHDEIPLTTQIP